MYLIAKCKVVEILIGKTFLKRNVPKRGRTIGIDETHMS